MRPSSSYLWLLATLLAACAGTPGPAAAPAPDATPAAQASAAATSTLVRGSLPPPRYPSPQPSAAAPAPTGAAPAPAAGTTVVSGVVLNDSGNPLYGAGVSIQSLDPKRPYSQRIIAEKGRYEITGVPVGVMVKVAANIRFYEPRSIMHTTGADPAANVVDFAGPYALPKQ